MKVQIVQIKVNEERREADPEGIQELADSISQVGLINPITIDQKYALIAGLHRLEAAKLLGWTEIECTVSSLEGLLAKLAEVDEAEAKRNLRGASPGDKKLKLSRLTPEQQKDAAIQLAAKDIRSMDQYRPAPAEPEKTQRPELDPPPEVPAPPAVPYSTRWWEQRQRGACRCCP